MTKKFNNSHTPTGREGQESEKTSKKSSWKKYAIIAALVTILGAGGDAGVACLRKKIDRKKYGTIELKNNGAKTYEESSNNIAYFPGENGEIDSLRLQDFLDEILIQNNYNNDSISSTALLTTMTSENVLKSDGRGHDIDEGLEKLGIERSKNSGSIIGFSLSKLGNGSYGRFQTQREAIENGYKNDPIRYENICKKIANFKLPNNNGEREELYKQLKYKSDDEMIASLKEKDIPVYTCGERVGIALGIGLLNEQLIDRNEGWKKYNEAEVIKKTQKIKAKHLESFDINDPIRQALNREGSDGEKLKSIYILSESNKQNGLNRISFSDIQKTLQSPAFKSGELQAGRCSHVQARKNGEYLLDLNIAELNQRFNNEINGNHGDLKITIPTGTFGPTSKNLAVMYLNLPNELKDKDPQDIKNYLNEHPEIINEFKDKVIANYIINFQKLFLLNGSKEEIKEGKSSRNELSEKQMSFLEQNLNLSFNHLYISAQCFKDYVKEKNGHTEKLNSLRDNYITNVENSEKQKEKRQNIAKILTHKTEFMNATGLKESDYDFFIKYRLGPALLGTSIILSETGNVVPEIQKQSSSTSNEVNTIYRFYAGVKDELQRMEEAKKGTHIATITGETTGKIQMKKIKEAISKNETIMKYIQENCRNPEGNPITNINSISDEIIEHFINIQEIENGKKIYFNTRNIEQIVTNTPILGIARKGDTFCDYIFELQKNDRSFSQILKRIIGKDSIEKNDITKGVIRQLIRKPDGSMWKDLNTLQPGNSFLIVIPLTTGTPQNIDVNSITPTIIPLRKSIETQMKASTTTKKETGKTYSKKLNKEKENINPRKNVPTPRNKSIPPQQRHTSQKR